MIYKILHKRVGANPTTFLEFDCQEKIVDFVSNGDSLYFLSNNHLFVVNKDKKFRPYGGFEFSYATSLDWQFSMKRLIVADNGGRDILGIDDERIGAYRLFGLAEQNFISNLLKKLGNNLTAKIKIDSRSNLYCMVKEANRIFFNSATNSMKCLVGNGFATYSQSMYADTSSLNFPNSIDLHDRKLFIADTGNNVIRLYNGGPLKTVIGHPLRKQVTPSQVVVTKDILYYVSNNVYTTNLVTPNHNNIPEYSTNKEIIVKKCGDESNNIYLMESYAN